MEKILAIFNLLRETVGSHCINPGCNLRHQRVDGDCETCHGCEQRLQPKNRVNWRLAAPLLALLLFLIGLATYLAQGVLERRATAREQELLSQAAARFQGELRGATQSDVGAIASNMQAEYRLTEAQRQKVVDVSRDQIDRLPRALTYEAGQKLEKVVRDVYSDGRLSREERKRLDRFAQEERLAPATLANVEERLRGRLKFRSRVSREASRTSGKRNMRRRARNSCAPPRAIRVMPPLGPTWGLQTNT